MLIGSSIQDVLTTAAEAAAASAAPSTRSYSAPYSPSVLLSHFKIPVPVEPKKFWSVTTVDSLRKLQKNF